MASDADALAAFLRRDFDRVHAVLHSLSDDPRVRHNALISSFYQRPSARTLQEYLLYVSRTFPPASSSSSSASTTSPEQFFARLSDDPGLIRYIHSHAGPVALYNVSLVAYHLQRVDVAAAVGVYLFDHIEGMDDWLALLTCFLLTDVHLRLSQIPAANAALSLAEKLMPALATPSSSTLPPASARTQGDDQTTLPTSAVRALSPHWDGRRTAILEPPMSYEHAKFYMHIYNARLTASGEAPDGVVRSHRKEAKAAVLAADDAQSRPTSAALLVKARVEQSFSKGLRILESIVNHRASHMLAKVTPVALNSLGVLHHRLGRHGLAACYFEHSLRQFERLFKSKATEADSNMEGEGEDAGEGEDGGKGDTDKDTANTNDRECGEGWHLSVMSRAGETHVGYNLGVECIKVGAFERGLQLLTGCAKADPVFAERSALLWMRMAECCVGMENGGDEKEGWLTMDGRGRSRRMVVRAGREADVAVMEYAARCARAALKIVEGRGKRRDAETGEGDVGEGGVSDEEIRGAAWAVVGYAGLWFDAESVLEAAEVMTQVYPKRDHARCALAELYAAEACCMLGRAREGAKRLGRLLSAGSSTSGGTGNATTTTGMSMTTSGMNHAHNHNHNHSNSINHHNHNNHMNNTNNNKESGTSTSATTTEEETREAASINLALVHACGEDLGTATRAARAAVKACAGGGRLRRQALLAAGYVFVRNGETDAARGVLRLVNSVHE